MKEFFKYWISVLISAVLAVLLCRIFDYHPNIMECMILAYCIVIYYDTNDKKKSPPTE